MLRRQPTQITLTADDIAAYEESRLARLAQPSSSDPNAYSQESPGSARQKPLQVDPNDELKPLPTEKPRAVWYHGNRPNMPAAGESSRARTRDERIGTNR